MVRLADRLPVVAIPEQRLVTPVRYAVIDDGCRLYLPGGRASNAERMRGQERCPCLLPLRSVSSCRRRSTPCVMLSVAMDALISLRTASGRDVNRRTLWHSWRTHFFGGGGVVARPCLASGAHTPTMVVITRRVVSLRLASVNISYRSGFLAI